jgi:uncharacterized protein (TIGR02453 family)
MAFRGWPAEALEFFEGLEVENTKAYWERNKAVYDEKVRAPMEALLAELAPDWGEGKLFRPYRDVRFSKDKSPYKTAIGALLDVGYIQLSAEGLACGYGMYDMATDQLRRYRDAVVDDETGGALADLVDGLRPEGIDVMAHGELKTAPRGYPKDHPRAQLLRLKGLATWKAWPVRAWLGTARAKDRVVGFLEASRPVGDWLEAHVGPSELPDER